MQGADDIQSYCLGHTSFVTCATFLSSPEGTVLVSGGGDGTIRYCRTVSPPAVPMPEHNLRSAQTLACALTFPL